MWERTTGLPDTIDWSASCRDNSQNTYITGNTIETGEKANILTTKYNSAGDEVWQVEYNSSYNDNDYGTAIEVDGSGNVYIAAASYTSSTNHYDYRVIKYNSSGTEQWNVTYNGPGNFYDIPSNILIDGSGNVYVTGGSTGSGTLFDYCTIKYNASGTQQWVSRYNYNGHDDFPGGLAINSQGKILVTGGSAQATDNWDFASIKLDPSSGSQLDVKRNTASGLGVDRVYGFAIDGADNLYIAGRAEVSGEGYNMKVVKLDSLLNTTWSKTYDLATQDDEAHGVVVDYLGNVYITGFGTTADGAKNFITRKYNASGTQLWSKQEAANNGSDLDAEATDLALEEYGNIYITGTVNNGANTDFMTVIYNASGDKLWTEVYDGGFGDDTPYFVNCDIDNQFYVGGKIFNGTSYTYKLIRYKKATYILPPDDDTEKPAAFTFFENKGQLINTNDDAVDYIKYYTNRHYPSLYLDDDTLHYVFSRIDTNTTTDDTLSRIAMTFYNSSTSKFIHHAENKGGEYLNYFLAHTGPQGVTNVRHFDRLYESEVYPYVDVMYYFDNGGLKYYLIIKPGWNAQQNPIKLQYDGATPSILTGNKLKLSTDIGEIIQKSADAYQISASGTLISLGWDATYTITSGKVGFTLGSYDDTKVLVIEIGYELLGGGGGCEPNVIWGTYYPGEEDDRITDVKINSFDGYTEPALYVSGVTTSPIFPEELSYISDLTGFLFDIFIQKFNLDITDPEYDKYEAFWGTYIGGSNDEYYADYVSNNCKLAIIETAAGAKKIYFIGETKSDDLPVFDNALSDPDNFFDPDLNATVDGLVGMINNAGNLNWLSYLGGNTGSTYLQSIERTQNNGVIIVGRSLGGDDFPFYSPGGTMPHYDTDREGCIVELDEENHLRLGTLFGSVSADWIQDVTVDAENNYIITGDVYGDDLDITSGACQVSRAGLSDVFVAKINPDGDNRDLEWCTFYGGAGYDHGVALTTDENNDIWVSGRTYNYGISDPNKFPLISGGYYDDNTFTEDALADNKAFILKLNSEGECLWSTLFGGDNHTFPRDMTNNGNNVLVVGYEYEANDNFPFEPSIYDVYFDDIEGDEVTSFISMFNINTSLVWSTFIGDDAHNNALSATVNTIYANELYVVGSISYSFPSVTFLPLCDPGDDSFYEDYIAGGISGNDGFILGFELDMFPTPPTSNYSENSFYRFNVYPNPASNSICIDFPKSSIHDVYIYDLAGNKLLNTREIDSKALLDISNLPSGTYLITAISDNAFNKSILVKL